MGADFTQNITGWFQTAFMGNFIISLLNFGFFTFFDPKIRQMRKQRELNRNPILKDATYVTTVVIEVVISVVQYVATGLSLMLLFSKAGRYCTHNTLAEEGQWLLGLVVFQAVLIPVNILWKRSLEN